MQTPVKSKPRNTANELRIIGGTYRSRKLFFPNEEGLRPTGNRIRETLFNWLAAEIPGANCLDLFAGSGALGMEALSRGASRCIFVDVSHRVCASIKNNLECLDPALIASQRSAVICADSLRWLDRADQEIDRAAPIDIVFLDPPFALGMIESACNKLEKSGLLSSRCLIYIETPATKAPAVMPANWNPLKHSKAGQVGYGLWRRTA